MGMSEAEQKDLLRKQMKARLKGVTPEQHRDLRVRLRSWLAHESGIWGTFSPIPGEPDLRPLAAELDHMIWVYPRVEGDRIEFRIPQDEDWELGDFGVREPSSQCPRVDLAKIRGLLIPGLAFDRQGYRLGRGKGFYDRCLQGWAGMKVGVGFEMQRVDSLPCEAHDQKVDFVVTEAGLWLP